MVSKMPELPDVEARRRYFEEATAGKKVEKVSVSDARILDRTTPAALARGLKGARFTDTNRRGKYLLAHTDKPVTLLLHFGMTGDLVYREKGKQRPRYDRAAFCFEGGSCLHFTDQRLFGKVALYRETADEDIPDIAKLGPEPLGRSFTLRRFASIVKGHRTTIHQLLMDQELIAGIGNIFSDEITYQAGVRPDRLTTSLSDEEIRRLFDRTKWVLKRAIQLNADLDGHADTFIIPNRGKDGECPGSHEKLARKTIGGRTSYYCPSCQK